jgi:hypothetical protein
MTERRIFRPRRTDDLVSRVKPWVGQTVTVRWWHPIVTEEIQQQFPGDTQLGWMVEPSAYAPESELLRVDSSGWACDDYLDKDGLARLVDDIETENRSASDTDKP